MGLSCRPPEGLVPRLHSARKGEVAPGARCVALGPYVTLGGTWALRGGGPLSALGSWHRSARGSDRLAPLGPWRLGARGRSRWTLAGTETHVSSWVMECGGAGAGERAWHRHDPLLRRGPS